MKTFVRRDCRLPVKDRTRFTGWEVGEGLLPAYRPQGARGLSSRPRPLSVTWDRNGLEKLVNDGVRAIKDAVPGLVLPSNLAQFGPWVSFPNRGAQSKRRDEMVEAAARFAGFLHALAACPAKFPLTLRLIRRCAGATTTNGYPRGVNSPLNSLDLYSLSSRFKGPGGVESLLGKAVRRADGILAPYGLRCSWQALAEVMKRGDRRPARVALRAAAWTAWDWSCRRLGISLYAYPESRPRDVLIELRGLRRLVAVPLVSADRRNRWKHHPAAVFVNEAMRAGISLSRAADAWSDHVRRERLAELAKDHAWAERLGEPAVLAHALLELPAADIDALLACPGVFLAMNCVLPTAAPHGPLRALAERLEAAGPAGDYEAAFDAGLPYEARNDSGAVASRAAALRREANRLMAAARDELPGLLPDDVWRAAATSCLALHDWLVSLPPKER